MDSDDFGFVVFSVAVVLLVLALSFSLLINIQHEQKEHQRICAEKNAIPILTVGRWACVSEVK